MKSYRDVALGPNGADSHIPIIWLLRRYPGIGAEYALIRAIPGDYAHLN
jgi:hypothetical protein